MTWGDTQNASVELRNPQRRLGCASTKKNNQWLDASRKHPPLLSLRRQQKVNKSQVTVHSRIQSVRGTIGASPQSGGSRRTRPTNFFVALAGEWTPSGYQPVHGDRPRRACLLSPFGLAGGTGLCLGVVGSSEISFNTRAPGRGQR